MILTKQQIVLATTNQGKAAEFAALLKELPVEVRTLKDYPQIPDIIEDGNTFIDNALIKARTVAKACGQVAMADDSGLMVDVLNGAQRGAQFCCAIAIVLPDGREYTTEGICRGQITFAPAGSGGFGYDPVFYVPKLQKTFAELSMGEKNAVSHRGIANAQALEILQKLFKEGV